MKILEKSSVLVGLFQLKITQVKSSCEVSLTCYVWQSNWKPGME